MPIEARSNGRSRSTLDILTPPATPVVPTGAADGEHQRAQRAWATSSPGRRCSSCSTWWVRHCRRTAGRKTAADGAHRHPAAIARTPSEPLGGRRRLGLSPDAATSTLPPS